ncbi:MAG: ThuA domain-containing protein [Planctomycetota bacterium]
MTMRYTSCLPAVLALLALGAGTRAEEEVDPYDQSKVPLEVEPTDPNAIKIVLVAGSKSHGPNDHEYFAGLALLANMLRQTPNVFPVMAREGWPKNEKIFEGAKSIAFFSDGRAGHPIVKPGRMDILQKYIDQGAGWVNIHYAVDYPPAVGDRILTWMGGYYDVGCSVNPFWVADFKSIPEHPVTRGLKPFTARDEWYYNMRFCEGMKGVTPLLQAVPPDNTRGTADAKKYPGRAEIVAWAFERPNGGRSFGFTGGHSHKFFEEVNFRRIITNALLWTAKVEVPADGAKVDLDPKDLMRYLDDKGQKKKPK